jgi:hypothetical protein
LLAPDRDYRVEIAVYEGCTRVLVDGNRSSPTAIRVRSRTAISAFARPGRARRSTTSRYNSSNNRRRLNHLNAAPHPDRPARPVLAGRVRPGQRRRPQEKARPPADAMLHALEVNYPTPYRAMDAAEVKAVLDRVFAYLDAPRRPK